ncbi:pentatricopeptide repeat-containing protein At3g61360-like [Rhodamnia argentea]|uniref:Pentatricopeptide repeat-containing protein At3g61360-like n=1 Tax=Rhodamnia argentea TaxID=178133 RepID=A0ABM3HWU6_9MYRT|nr:pentatricopeptide repeat-containing protein At3g61360-like [Rhodamnia argentea]
MSCSMKLLTQNQFARIPHQRFLSRLFCTTVPLGKDNEIDKIAKVINDHPFPDSTLQTVLQKHIPPHTLSAGFVEDVVGHLFGAHSNGLKALEFFRYTVRHLSCGPTSVAFERTLHILARMRYFEKAWELMEEMRVMHPSVLTLKAMSIMMLKTAKFKSYEDTLLAFERMENDVFVGRKFGTDEFNILLRAFCTHKQMKEARSVFNKMHSRFSPDTKTMNILLLGFKDSGDVSSMELFYHEMVRRGFKPNTVTYNIRIDAYCKNGKRGCVGDGLRLLEEMEGAGCLPTVETFTTLIHGAGVARNLTKAKELFDGILTKNMQPDTAAYNAMISVLIKAKYVKAAIALMDEMEAKQIRHDNMTYHTLFFGLMRSREIDGVYELYHRMVERNFVPKTRTVVMLMKYFCINRQVDMGLHLWEYLVGKGHCPHGHALDLLVIGLCSRGRELEAFECSKQMLERGRLMTEATFRMLGGLLLQAGEADKLRKLNQLVKTLKAVLPLSKGHADGIANSLEFNAERTFSS